MKRSPAGPATDVLVGNRTWTILNTNLATSETSQNLMIRRLIRYWNGALPQYQMPRNSRRLPTSPQLPSPLKLQDPKSSPGDSPPSQISANRLNALCESSHRQSISNSFLEHDIEDKCMNGIWKRVHYAGVEHVYMTWTIVITTLINIPRIGYQDHGKGARR